MSDRRALSGTVGWGVGGAFILHAVMIALAVGWVAFYSYVVDPGHDQGYYEAYAQQSSPVVSVVAGGPLFYMVAAWLTRRNSPRAARIATALYLATDVAILAGTGSFTGRIALFFAGGAFLKLIGTALGIQRART